MQTNRNLSRTLLVGALVSLLCACAEEGREEQPDAATVMGDGGTRVTEVPDSGTSVGVEHALPCAVEQMFQARCWSCHGAKPSAPMSLVSVEDLRAPSISTPAVSMAEQSLARCRDDRRPMPPVPSARATTAELSALESWIKGGYPNGGACGSPDAGVLDAGMSSTPDAGGVDAGQPDSGTPDAGSPFDVPPTCTSKSYWTSGNSGSRYMHPGGACISCHASRGPLFNAAGTVYPTGHEPNDCDGAAMGTVVITDATGKVFQVALNAAGNFYFTSAIAKPYSAKVTFQGRERQMLSKQTSGDCNLCHTQQGASGAPGRIVLP